MSNFKDIVQNDIHSVFLNIQEFGEEHYIDGSSMPVIVDDFEASEREVKYAGDRSGTYKIHRLIYVAEKDFGALPTQGRIITFDGKKYTVQDAVSEGGVHSITLEAVTNGDSAGRRFPSQY